MNFARLNFCRIYLLAELLYLFSALAPRTRARRYQGELARVLCCSSLRRIECTSDLREGTEEQPLTVAAAALLRQSQTWRHNLRLGKQMSSP